MMKRLSFLNKATPSVPAAALILGGSILASRVLGLVRDRILAGMFGAGVELDIYFAAFRVPDLIYSIIIGGAVSSAFIPVFIHHYTKNNQEAWDIARSFFYFAMVGLIVICAAVFILMPFLMPLVIPGFDTAAQNLATSMSRVMLLSPLFLGLSAVLSGILHSFRKFFVYSLAPVFYNVGIIIGALWFTDFAGVEGLAWGVALGAFMHMAIQAPVAVSSGFRFSPPKKLFNPAIARIIRLMVPRAIGLGAFQVNMWVITAIASTIAVGSLTVFNLANHLHYLPVGLIGTSFATAVFPALSFSASNQKYREYLHEISRTLRGVLFLVFPVGVLFFILRAHIVRVVLGTGEFGWEATRLTAAALGAFSIGIFAYTLMPVLSKAFYARENTKTPVIATTVGMATNIILSSLLIFVVFPSDGILEMLSGILKVEGVPGVAVIGLPLSFAISGIVSLIVLSFAFFRDKRNTEILGDLSAAFFRIVIASIFTGFVGWIVLRWMGMLLDPVDTFISVITQAGVASFAALGLYIAIAYIFKFNEFSVLVGFVRTKLKKVKVPRQDHTHNLDGFGEQ